MSESYGRRLCLSLLGILSLVATLGSASAVTNTGNATDIAVSIAADRKIVRVGQDVTFTMTATNLGPGDATFVDFGLQLPAQFVVLSMSCDLGISPDGSFCEYSSLPSGATVVSEVVVTPKLDSGPRGRVLPTSVSMLFENADAVDPNLGNNTASVKVKIVGRLTQP